jgi:hypothetical protein
MEKQLYLFQTEEKKAAVIWHSLPEERRSKIEMNFAKLLIKYLCKSIEETAKNEN